MTTQRKLRIEVIDETDNGPDLPAGYRTIAEVFIELPYKMDVPGDRLIEGARLAYRHVVGADFPQVLGTGAPQ